MLAEKSPPYTGDRRDDLCKAMVVATIEQREDGPVGREQLRRTVDAPEETLRAAIEDLQQSGIVTQGRGTVSLGSEKNVRRFKSLVQNLWVRGKHE